MIFYLKVIDNLDFSLNKLLMNMIYCRTFFDDFNFLWKLSITLLNYSHVIDNFLFSIEKLGITLIFYKIVMDNFYFFIKKVIDNIDFS